MSYIDKAGRRMLMDNPIGAAFGPQRERMDAGIYFSLFIVVLDKNDRYAIYFLPGEMQTEEMFVERAPLKPGARRAGWIGTKIDLTKALALPILLTRSNAD